MANRMRNWVTSAIQVKIGIFIRLMPRARMLKTVVIRFTAPTSEATPAIIRPRFQKSTPWPGV
jgi:hypothetical protein